MKRLYSFKKGFETRAGQVETGVGSYKKDRVLRNKSIAIIIKSQ